MIEYSREFIQLASCLNFAKAAQQLNTSQPSLSRHIAELERQLGFKLLERKPVALTPAGKYYLESISAIVQQIDATLERGRQIAHGDQGVLTICMVPFDMGVYSDVVYKSIAQIRSLRPRLVTQQFASRTHSILEAVQANKADIGVVFDTPHDLPEELECTWIMDYPCMVWAHKDNPVLRSNPTEFEAFKSCKLVNYSNKLFSAWFDAEAAVMRSLGITPNVRMRDIESAADFFIDLQPDEIKISCEMNVGCPYNPNVVGVRFDYTGREPVTFSTYLVYRKRPSKPSVPEFVRICSEVARQYQLDTSNYSFSTRG